MKLLNTVEGFKGYDPQISAEISLTSKEISLIVEALQKGIANGIFGADYVLESRALFTQFKDVETAVLYDESKLNEYEGDF